jgi:hypothetical protein
MRGREVFFDVSGRRARWVLLIETIVALTAFALAGFIVLALLGT